MANYVKWEQSGINSNVKPPINRGKGYVAKSATPYRQLLELDLPADFSGKEALLATQKGMEACYSGADQLPGILSGIGRGMTLKDNASYAGLMDLFKTTKQKIDMTTVAGTIFEKEGYLPSDSEVQKILASSIGNTGGYGYGWGYVDQNAANVANARWETAAEATKNFFSGLLGGAISYLDETATGAVTAFAFGIKFLTLPNDVSMQERILASSKCAAEWNSKMTTLDLTGRYENYVSKNWGVDTNSLAYKGGKVVGNVVTSTVVSAAVPGGSWYSIVTAGTTSYGKSLGADIKAKGGLSNMSDKDILAANAHAGRAGVISSGTSALTGWLNKSDHSPFKLKSKLDTSNPLGNYYTSQGKRIAANFTMNTVIGGGSEALSQINDKAYGTRDKVNVLDVVVHGAASGAVALGSAASKASENVSKYSSNGKVASKDTIKIIRDTKNAVGNMKIQQATGIPAKAVKYVENELSKDGALVNSSIKLTSSTAAKIIKDHGRSILEKVFK